MLKIFFLFTLAIYLVENNQNNINYENIFNLVSVGSTISGNTFDSFNEVSLKDARQCISICTYSKKCKAFDALPVPNGIECRFFEFDFDFFVGARGSLENKNGVKLYSTKIPIKTCQDWYKAGYRANGVYKVHLPRSPVARSVYCYMEGEGGGWMAFQRRFNGSVDFHTKLWKDYKNGFGNGEGEYWLGNDMLHDITRSGSHDLYVIAKNFNGNIQYKRFRGFTIGSEATKYRFHYESVYTGYSTYDLFVKPLNMKFTTPDQDNDVNQDNCAVSYPGGWWFNSCHHDYMNGNYSQSETCPRATGLHWFIWQSNDHKKCLKETMLMIKKR